VASEYEPLSDFLYASYAGQEFGGAHVLADEDLTTGNIARLVPEMVSP
jgi:hypothetical protein